MEDKVKVLTIAGTRPEWIRLCLIIPKLDELVHHVLVDTGQNYDKNLRDVFFKELQIRKPDYRLNATGSFGEQMAIMLPQLEAIILNEKPDAFLVLGDTNSSLGAIMAKRLGVKVFHMEAGNRCFDDRVPEEVNRRIIDHSSDILLPYTERSRQNLLDEGIHSSRIYVTGNPISEVLEAYKHEINDSKIQFAQGVDTRRFLLITLHRAENVDNPERLDKFVELINQLPEIYEMPIIWSLHPRTKKRLTQKINYNVRLLDPLGLFDFARLESNAYCVLTDSGTVQEECSIFDIPVVTLRDSTERPETIETGSNIISGCEPDDILRAIRTATTFGSNGSPPEYKVENVSDTVVKIVTGYWNV